MCFNFALRSDAWSGAYMTEFVSTKINNLHWNVNCFSSASSHMADVKSFIVWTGMCRHLDYDGQQNELAVIE